MSVSYEYSSLVNNGMLLWAKGSAGNWCDWCPIHEQASGLTCELQSLIASQSHSSSAATLGNQRLIPLQNNFTIAVYLLFRRNTKFTSVNMRDKR